MFFGPRVFSKKLVQYFLDYNGHYGDRWEGLFVPLLQAMRNGTELVDLPVDYEHPAQQTALEQENVFFLRKRLEQLSLLREVLDCEWDRLYRHA